MADPIAVNRYNRIVLTQSIPGWYSKTEDRYHGAEHAFPFILEELIALSAVEIIIPSSHQATNYISSLDPLLAKRIKVIDDTDTTRSTQGILAPIELEVPFTKELDYLAKADQDFASYYTPLLSDISELRSGINQYLFAVKCQAEVDIHLLNLKTVISKLRKHLKSPESRAILATLSGIFNVYNPVSCDALIVHPDGGPELIQLFEDIVRDASYREASREAKNLGVPKKLRRAHALIRRQLQKVVSRPAFRGLIDFGGRIITAATGIPVPSSDLAAQLVSSGYLPPMVDVKRAVERGRRAWIERI